jgi:hypothetical protein
LNDRFIAGPEEGTCEPGGRGSCVILDGGDDDGDVADYMRKAVLMVPVETPTKSRMKE